MYGMTECLDNSTLGHSHALSAPTPMDDSEHHNYVFHQRGRRRRRSPPPVLTRDGISVPCALEMTPAHIGSPKQGIQNYSRITSRPSNRPRPRQETPSGSSGTFRGRRRHRSPSVGPTSVFSVATVAAAIRKASTQPRTRSSSVASSMRLVSSRPSSPHDWLMAATSSAWTPRSISRSRGRRGQGPTSSGGNGNGSSKRGHESSPSPRRKATPFRALKDMDHGIGNQYGSHDYDHHHHFIHSRYYTKPKSRRSHCPSRSGSIERFHHEEKDGYDLAALASRRRRRRQRTHSRPRPRRANTGDSMSSATKDVFGLTSYYTLFNSSLTRLTAAHNDSVTSDPCSKSSRVQFSVMLGDSSDTTSDGEDMDVEMG